LPLAVTPAPAARQLARLARLYAAGALSDDERAALDARIRAVPLT
jgi:hypothetical protein